MRTSTKLKIDRLIGGGACLVLNQIIKVGKRIKRHDEIAGPFQNVCVAKYVGMGSILNALPMLKAIKQNNPLIRLTFITSLNNKQLTDLISIFDNVFFVDESSPGRIVASLFKIIWKLWKLRPQVFLDLELYSYFSSLMCFFSLAPRRVGFFRKSTSLKDGLYHKLVYFNVFAPVAELYLELARRSALVTNGDLDRNVRSLIKLAPYRFDPLRPRVVMINPNASDLSHERRWPAVHFATLITRLLQEQRDINIEIVGARSERALGDQILAEVGPDSRVKNQSGFYSIASFMTALERAELLITNDSGPMHMAFALNVRTICLFGPVHPAQFLTLAKPGSTQVFYRQILCNPCVHQTETPPCGGDNVCMKKITVGEVFEATLNALSQYPHDRSPAGSRAPAPTYL